MIFRQQQFNWCPAECCYQCQRSEVASTAIVSPSLFSASFRRTIARDRASMRWSDFRIADQPLQRAETLRQQQRVAIACAIDPDPKMIPEDESSPFT